MMNHNPLKASAAKPLSRGVAAQSVIRGDGMGRRDQTSAGGTHGPSSVGNAYHGVMRCVNHYIMRYLYRGFPGMFFFFGMASSEIFRWVVFQRKLIPIPVLLKKNDAIVFLNKKNTSFLPSWHQKIDWGESDSHIHLIPSMMHMTRKVAEGVIKKGNKAWFEKPTHWNYLLDLQWMLHLAVELWLAHDITCATPISLKSHRWKNMKKQLRTCRFANSRPHLMRIMAENVSKV